MRAHVLAHGKKGALALAGGLQEVDRREKMSSLAVRREW